MPKIEQLSPHVADLIAAGEVVERPASAAKELVENAIDAGATHITVELKDGGMTFLRVTDDGCGMSAQDAPVAFLRHATSKLHKAQDLEAISTLGFRGEALAAISAVSRIDLLTKTAEASMGVGLHLEAGVVKESGSAGCPDGTTIIVRDLFYNTPARMKFMRRDSVESAAAVSAVGRLALAHPEVALRVLADGQEQFQTSGDGKLYSAIYSILGRQFASDLVAVDSHWDAYRLTGFVSRPTATRGNRANQLFFVNGRNIRSKTMSAALEEAYRNQLMTGRFPSCVLQLTLPEKLVDVNVHPAKTEIRFINERDLFDCVHYGVQGALERTDGKVTMRLPSERPSASTAQPTLHGKTPAMRAADFRALTQLMSTPAAPDLRPAAQVAQSRPDTPPAAPRAAQRQAVSPTPPPQAKPAAPEKAPAAETAPPAPEKAPAAPAQPVEAPADVPQDTPVQQQTLLPDAPDWRVIGEALNTYILVEQGKSLLLIDKHAAHERLLFEKFRSTPEPVTAQLLLTPLLWQPEREEAALLLSERALLQACGFALEDYGDGMLAIGQIPAQLSQDDAIVTLGHLASDLRAGRRADRTALRDTLLHTVACKAAVKGGRPTDALEDEALVREVLTREDLKYCPHGRPICLRLTQAQLEKQFKRT